MQLKLKRLTQVFVITASAGVMAWVAVAQQRAPEVVTTSGLINAAGNGAEWLSYVEEFAARAPSSLNAAVGGNLVRDLFVLERADPDFPPAACRQSVGDPQLLRV